MTAANIITRIAVVCACGSIGSMIGAITGSNLLAICFGLTGLVVGYFFPLDK